MNVSISNEGSRRTPITSNKKQVFVKRECVPGIKFMFNSSYSFRVLGKRNISCSRTSSWKKKSLLFIAHLKEHQNVFLLKENTLGYSEKHPPNFSTLGSSFGAEPTTVINHLKSTTSFSRNLATSPTASWTLGLVTHCNNLCFIVEEV